MKKINACVLRFTRHNGNQLLYIKTTPKLEGLFKTDSVETSTRYLDKNGKGLSYYVDIADKFDNLSKSGGEDGVTLKSYGTSLYLDNRLTNYSILRTVGISRGIVVRVDSLATDGQVKNWMEYTAQFIKKLYRNNLINVDIRATITLEF